MLLSILIVPFHGPTATAAADVAPGTITMDRSSVTAGEVRSYTLRYGAGTTPRVRGTMFIQMSSEWTPPQTASSRRPGFISVSRGSCAKARLLRIERFTAGERRLTLSVDCKRSRSFTLSYRNATAPTMAGEYEWFVTAKFNDWGTQVPVRPGLKIAVAAGPATQLVQPYANDDRPGEALNTWVAVADQFGNVAAGAPRPVTVTLSGCPNAVLSGTLTVDNSDSGYASFKDLFLDRACRTARLTYTSPGLKPASTNEFRVAGRWESVADNGAPLAYGVAELHDGRIAFFGETARIYDPATRQFSSAAVPPDPQRSARAVTMTDGRVLVVSGETTDGRNSQHAYVYDPVLDRWQSAADRPVEIANRTYNDALVLLDDGRILDVPQSHDGIVEPMVYDPSSDSWTAAPLIQRSTRQGMAVVKLKDGRVLLSGGSSRDELYLRESEIFDPRTDEWTQVASSPAGTTWSQPIALRNGTAMLIGSQGSNTTTVQTYDPARDTWSSAPSLDTDMYGYASILRADGFAMVAGGTSYSNYPKYQPTVIAIDTAASRPMWLREGSIAPASNQRPALVARPDNSVLFFDYPTGKVQQYR